ncbi:hypothetical protein A1O1_04679 [Capronia coronata CBS 617.96]|uniref:Uncharacterized protein n=1 Tax=Capronia coronata CBS 617.96 TaxID=1182541 RepID=W9Y5E6_9EURO|nr:uncharacterized protein A1O1_04679 [Capronia coronata CBS 617.96]EXJ87753.1 hypothetical protein A1O1_04679 [Capronia coronata CBS 617.96]
MNGTNQHNLFTYHAVVDPSIDAAIPPEQPQYSPGAASTSMTLAGPVTSVKRSPTPDENGLNNSTFVSPMPWSSSRLSASAISLPQPAFAPTDSPRPFTADASLSKTHQHIIQPLPPTLTVPAPVAYSMSQSSVSIPSFYHPANSPRLDLPRNSPIQYDRELATPTTVHSRQSSTDISVGPSAIVYETQLPEYWSARPEAHDLASSLSHARTDLPIESADQGSSQGGNHGNNGSLDPLDGKRDAGQQSRMGIMTVPGKKDTKVLRKKSLRRI